MTKPRLKLGRLTRDPEMRYTNTGTPVTGFTLAVERPFTNSAGEREADFIDCVAWRKAAETVANNLTKGRLVAVEGRLQIRSYEAQDGSKRKASEIVTDNVRFLDYPKDGAKGSTSHATGDPDEVALPDDLPF